MSSIIRYTTSDHNVVTTSKLNFYNKDDEQLNVVSNIYNGDWGEITCSEDIDVIGIRSFANEERLTKVVIPDSVTYIDGSAFNGCNRLIDVIMSNNVEYIRDFSFTGCSSIAEITLPSSLKILGAYAFKDCESLTSIQIPANTNTIYQGAFENCCNLTNVELLCDYVRLGVNIFSGCKNLESFSGNYYGISSDGKCLSSGNKLIGFAPKDLQEYIVPESIHSIRINHICTETFAFCDSLIKITIGTNINYIEDNAFYRSMNLTEIETMSKPVIHSHTFRSVNDSGILTHPRNVDFSDWLALLGPNWEEHTK